MPNPISWTKSKARLKFIRENDDQKFNWLFLPGGPGLGSESLQELVEILNLPGSMWCLDLPGDGSNTGDFANWQQGLIEATVLVENVILVAHSSGGMFALATPEIEKNLSGLVLMDSAPNAGWQVHFMNYLNNHPLPEVEKLEKAFEKNPTNDLLKQLTIACAPYFSIAKNTPKIIALLQGLPFNSKSFLWAKKNFDPFYKATWIPKNIPTLIFAGDQDHLTPIKLFYELPEFKRENIVIHEIKDASHFPWMDNPEVVKKFFEEFLQLLLI